MKTNKVKTILLIAVLIASHLLTAQTVYFSDDFNYTDSPLNHGWGYWWAGSNNDCVTLTTVYDSGVSSRVMDLLTDPSSQSYSVVYPGSWNPIEVTNPIINFKFRTTTTTGGKYYFRVYCTNGNTYSLVFKLTSGTSGISGSDVTIYKGSTNADGNWHNISVNIKSELSPFVSTDIEEIQYIVFYGDVRVDDLVVTDGGSSSDTTPPTPNPMAFSTVPTATGSSSITMTAALASDPSGGIEYEFDCTAGGGPDRSWNSSRTFAPTGLSPSTTYSYRVRARDTHGNPTSYSSSASATTQAASGGETVWETSGDNIYYNDGNVGIGTTSLSTYKLNVNGSIRANEVVVSTTGADHVFSPHHNLISLEQIQKHILEYQHLPGIPSAQDMIENGMGVGEMQAILLEKIEELTLYMIEHEKKNLQQQQHIELLQVKIDNLTNNN